MNILDVLFGWILGILSPLVVEKVKKRLQREELKDGLIIELEEVQIKLISLTYLMNSDYGTFDRQFLQWIEPLVRKYKGIEISRVTNISKHINSLLLLTDGLLSEHVEQSRRESPTGASVKKFYLPFLNSKLDSLSLFDCEFQRRILDINAQLLTLNGEIERAQFYHAKTFDSSLGENNYNIVNKNLDMTYRNIGDMSRKLVDRIDIVISEKLTSHNTLKHHST
ncbi:MAG: hypothetical protein AB1401_09585 [Thermodesulfobacteriota bacterium]